MIGRYKQWPSGSEDIHIDEDPPMLTEVLDKMTKDKIDYNAKRLDYVIYALDVLINAPLDVHPRTVLDPHIVEVLRLMTKSSTDRINRYGEETRAKEQYLDLRAKLRELENDYPVLQDLK